LVTVFLRGRAQAGEDITWSFLVSTRGDDNLTRRLRDLYVTDRPEDTCNKVAEVDKIHENVMSICVCMCLYANV